HAAPPISQRGRALAAHLVAVPEHVEAGTGRGQVGDQLDQPGVVDVAAGRLPQVRDEALGDVLPRGQQRALVRVEEQIAQLVASGDQDRKSTRLNSSHVKISYAVFCLKKKTRRVTPTGRS